MDAVGDGLDEIVAEFLVESLENLDQLDRDLVALEREPDSRELLSRVFRTVHTIKGTSGFLAFPRLEAVSHAGESLLSRLRDGSLALTPARTDALLGLVDTIRALLASVEESGTEGDVAVDATIAGLTAVLEPAPDDVPGHAEPPAPAVAPSLVASPAREREAPRDESPRDESPRDDAPAPRLGELLVERGVATPEDVAAAVRSQLAGDTRPLGEILVAERRVDPDAIAEALATQSHRRVTDSTVRVDVDLLDSLVQLVDELAGARAEIVARAEVACDAELLRAAERLSLVTTGLQEAVVRARTQPIDHLWSKLPRVVRDLAQQCGKRVELEMEGCETELDRNVLEAVKDPLTHLVRNAIDHGIESPEQRRAAGKPGTGRLLLRAAREGDCVVVEVRDDGAGIDPAQVGARAVEQGLVPADRVAAMTSYELLDLVFLPGFTTAARVTTMSGRGVGMDVVRTNLAAVGGSVELASVPGRGTICRLTLP